MRGINLIVFAAVIVFGIQRVTAHGHVTNLTLTVNGTVFTIPVDSSVGPALLDLANTLADNLATAGIHIDVDECQTQIANECNRTVELCLNFPGNYSCICKEGYFRENSTAECAIDPCAAIECGNLTVCSANGTMAECSCIDGYEDGEEGSGAENLGCQDIDECARNTSDCDVNADCTNNEGSFNCSCKDGYSGDGSTCDDIDECTPNPVTACPSSRTFCENTEGSFECKCNSGFARDGSDTCEDIEECVNDLDDCDPNASCENTVGSHTCTCNEGYNGNGQTCSDIDECGTNVHDCHGEASCNNTIGSFNCACNDGYSGDGRNCTDIDECETSAHDCHDHARCDDTDGGFTCTCDDGYSGNGQSCTVGPEEFRIRVTVRSSARKRRAVNTTVFEDAFEQLLQTVLSFTGDTYDIDVQVVSSTTNPTDSTETFELLIISTPPAKQLLENILGDLEGDTVGGVTLQSILYSLNSIVTVSSSNSTITCAQVMSYVETELTNRGLITNETGVDCANTTGAIREFTVAVNNGYATVEKLGEILSNFEDFGDDEDDCAVDPCEERAVCTDLIGAFTCACNKYNHDANLTEPGTNCISPLVRPTCKADGIEVKVYRGYLNKLEINEDHVRVNGVKDCGFTNRNGQFLIYDIGFAGCGITSEQNEDSITHSFNLTNLINGWISNGPALSFPISCSYARTFSSSDDDDEAPSVSVIRGETIIQYASGEGSLTATLTVYTDSSFTTPLEASTNVSAGESIFVKVDHSSSESSNYMKLTQCWKTTVADPNDSNRFNLIENGCSTDDDHVIIANNGANETVDFEIIVQSVHADKFYLHCDVEVCVAPCTAVCPAARRRRRAIPASGRSITPFTVGPIYVDDKGDQEDGETESVSGPNTAAIVVGVALVAALCVVAFLVVRRRMERRTRDDVYRIDDPNQPTNQDFRSSLKAGFQNSRY